MSLMNQKTKESNTFRFRSFSDRVNQIDIRQTALYYIGHENEELLEEDETFFQQTIKKWIILNLTDEFKQFSKKCRNIVTLKQLIHKKDFIIDFLLEKLSTATTLSLQPLLEILVVLSKDLREEFYPYFQRVLDRLICLLNTQDADQLEWTLVCLAFLFKTLKPFLKRNISVIFHSILPLLDEDRWSEQVINFAVECFAFIARDILNQEKLLEVIIKSVEREGKTGISGCGRLFFEINRGVNGNFHSISEKFLPFLFKSLTNPNLEHKDILFEIIQETVLNILSFVHSSNVNVFWKSICEASETAVKIKVEDQIVNNIIQIIGMSVEYKNGKYLTETELVVTNILKIIDAYDESEHILTKVSALVCCVLLASSSKITQLDLSRMCKKMLNVKFRSVFEHFIWNIRTHQQFEILVLPTFLKFIETNCDSKSLELLVKIIQTKSPLCEDSRNLKSWKQYSIVLNNEIQNNLQTHIKNVNEDFASMDELSILTLLILPHIKNIEIEKFVPGLQNYLRLLVESISKLKKENEIQKQVFILGIVVECFIHLKVEIDHNIVTKTIDHLIQYCGNTNHIGALKVVNLILSYSFESRKEIFTAELFDKIHTIISNNLYSPFQDFRSLTTHTLNYFDSTECCDLNGIYNLFYKIETIVPNVQTYREQMLMVNKLLPGGELMKSLNNTKLVFDSIKALLGLLYYNFKLIWQPILKVIQDIVNSGISITEFWDIYKFKLEETARIINKEESDSTVITVLEQFESEVIQEVYKKCFENETKVDYNNYRNLLWSKLSEFGQVSEIKNRDVVTIFLKFVNEEYKVSQKRKILTWNLKQSSEINEMSDDEENENSGQKKKIKKFKKSDNSFKAIVDTLGTKLTVFMNQDNPKQMHRELELFQFYLELLVSTKPFLQKLALDCIMAYKNSSLIPYKEQLYNLVDEKKFKDELVNFKIDKESNVILLQHRPEMMKILLRILYGKMITKTITKNMNNQVRKGLVLRFLGGCEKDEIFWFVKMSLKDYGNIIETNCDDILKVIDADFSLDNVWSAKKLQSTINLIELIHKHFAGLMDAEFLTFILKIIIFVGYNCEKVLQNGTNLSNSKLLVVFRNVKTLALQSLIHFTKHFDEYEWQDNQIDIVNEIFVWPNIKKLPSDCIHSPTPLLKLLCAWSENIKHFPYLLKKDETGLIAFKYVVDLLLVEKAKPIIRRTVLEVIERILMTCQDETGRFDTKSVGAEIVSPYVPEILKRLKMNLSVKGGRKKLDTRDLNILSCSTHLVKDSETCDSLLEIFLPILIAKSKMTTSDEILQQAILTLSNLIKKLDNPQIYVRKICLLFVEVKEVTSRKLLCNLLDIIAKKCKNSPHLLELAGIVQELNAWDKRWIEQPDYDRRITIMKTMSKNVTEKPLNMDIGVLVICNCFYFLKYDKDMGLRDNSSELLKILIPKLLKDNQYLRKEVDFLIGEIILDIIRKIIRDNNDSVRGEGILLLGEIAKECHLFHPILNDLCSLADPNDDENDFFKNITHLQAFRHVKGLQRFCAVSRTLTEPPNMRTLIQFILPLTSRYLLIEKYAKKPTLVDTAIETIGVICQLLPWHQYQTVLKFYLQKMRFTNDFQKQAVRIVVTILDAFHFDLSNDNVEQKVIESFKKQFATELKLEEMKNPEEIDDNLEITNKLENSNEENSKMDESTVKEEPAEEDEENENDEDDNLDEALAEEEIDKEDLQKEEVKKLEPAVKTITILSQSASKKVIHTIASILIPTLNNAITEKSSYDRKHKINRKKYGMEREEEEILRVPIALALVKLLQKLPKEIFETSLPGVFMKVCTFLKSPLKSVRMLTRDILKKIMLALGSNYLPLLLEQLRSLLTRGFQVHVLSVTIHGVLDVLKDQFQPGDIEQCLQHILEVTLNDIFGEIADEKEIEKIGANTPEAKPSAKSYLSLHIAAKNIPQSCVLDMLIPFKEYLAKTHSKKNVLKIEACFQKIMIGLIENTLISRENLLYIVYGTISESITDLLPGTEKPQLTEKEKEKMMRARPDCFLIPALPKYRSGFVRKTVKTNTQANAHILIEFGLEMLNLIIRRKQLSEANYGPFLNPMIHILNNSLKSQHIKVTTYALKCLTSVWNGGYELEKCYEYMDEIVEQIFKIVHKYSTFGVIKKDDNFHLIRNSFKTIVSLLKNVEQFTMTSDQVGQLLFYIEQDILETDRQPIAMSLLKAVVLRKIQHEEVHKVMNNLQELSITSQSDFIRDEVRSILIHYLCEYPLKKKADGIIKFFTMQLNYEIPTGRLSAIKFLEMIIRKFPPNILIKKAEFLFLQLGTRLVNEEVPDCRIAVAECVEQLISRVDKLMKQKLFDINLMLLNNGQKPAIREMSAILFSRFVSLEKSSFAPRIKMLLPILVARLNLSNPAAPGRFVKAPTLIDPILNEDSNCTDESKKELLQQEKQKAIDHELIQIQICILKILEHCSENIFGNEDLNSTVDELAYESQKLLGYEHDWVRLNSAKIISYVLSNIDCDLVGKLFLKQEQIKENNIIFMHMTPDNDMKSLILDLCAQMTPGTTSEAMTEEVVKIFLLVANVLKVIPIRKFKQENFSEDDNNTDCYSINLNWLLRRMRYITQAEIMKAPHSCVLRTSIFNCFEGLITLLDVELIEQLAINIMSPLIREMSEDDQNIDPKLRQQATRIGNKLRKRLGADVYDKIRTEVQTRLMIRRAKRKKDVAIQKIVDPIQAAKRKHGVQERKKLAKKRKMEVKKGKIEGKKKRKRKLEDDMF